jgi:hypothetical protein
MINLYPQLLNCAAVTSYVGDRVFPAVAAQDAKGPFVVWQAISNTPFNSLSCIPDSDSERIQIDCYDSDPVAIRDLAIAVRDCLQVTGTVIDGPRPAGIDPDTRLFRWTMDTQYFNKRGA